jgi:hypothetical protein
LSIKLAQCQFDGMAEETGLKGVTWQQGVLARFFAPGRLLARGVPWKNRIQSIVIGLRTEIRRSKYDGGGNRKTYCPKTNPGRSAIWLGIMAERLAGGNIAVALLANTAATVAVLATLIALFGPISGAHFNPAVSNSVDGACKRRYAA